MSGPAGQLQVRAYYLDHTGAEQQFVITFTEALEQLLQKESQIRTSISAYMTLTGGTLLSVQMEVLNHRELYLPEQTQPVRTGKVLKFRRRLDLEL